jgi:hypothetical protein
MKGIYWIPIVIIVCITLSACGASQVSRSTIAPSATLTPTFTLTIAPTETFTPTRTPTATIIPIRYLSGILYFDINNSGKQDNDELGLQGFQVCTNECITTDSKGNYSIPYKDDGSLIHIKIIDPNQDETKKMKYITLVKGIENIPAWEWNGINYPEQSLTMRDIVPIGKGVSIDCARFFL